MSKGPFIGFLWAYDVLKDKSEYKNLIKKMTESLKRMRENNKIFKDKKTNQTLADLELATFMTVLDFGYADDKLNYTDILAYTIIPNLIKNENNKSIKVYHWVYENVVGVTEKFKGLLPEQVEKNQSSELINENSVNKTTIDETVVNEAQTEKNKTISNQKSNCHVWGWYK